MANLSREEQTAKNSSKSRYGYEKHQNQRLNVTGTPRTPGQEALEARKLARINALCHYLLVEDTTIAGILLPTIIQCIEYPDAHAARRCVRMCHRIIETVVSYQQYTELISRQLFTTIVKALVTEPKWMVGMEWDMISLVRDIYCRTSLGQYLQSGGLGASMQQPRSPSNPNEFVQNKIVSLPLEGGGILCTPSNIPRQILADLPGIGTTLVLDLDKEMCENLAGKIQKDLLRDLLRLAADNVKQRVGDKSIGGIFSRVEEEESVLNQKLRVSLVPALPEKLETYSHTMRNKVKVDCHSATDMVGGANLNGLFG